MFTLLLSFKFPGAEDVRKAHSKVPPSQNQTPLQIADEGFFVDTAAVLEGIAVEKDIAGDGTSLGAGKRYHVSLAVGSKMTPPKTVGCTRGGPKSRGRSLP